MRAINDFYIVEESVDFLPNNPCGAHSVDRHKVEVVVGIDNKSDPVWNILMTGRITRLVR